MSLLRIAQLKTTCHVPQQLSGCADVVAQLASGRFARDLGEHLGPSLSKQPAIVRIRQLRVHLIIPVRDLHEDALSLKWRHEFGKALFTALAYPTGAGLFEVFRAESVAGFLASAIRGLLDGTAADQWRYREFEPFFRFGNTQAALCLICEWPKETMAVLLELAQCGVLDRLLSRFDDVAMDRIFGALTSPRETEIEPLSVAALVAAAKLACGHLPKKVTALRSRAYALTLFVEADLARGPQRSPSALFHALLALAVLLNEGVPWPDIPQDKPSAGQLPSNVAAILESIVRESRQQMPSPSETDSVGAIPATFEVKTQGHPQPRSERVSPQFGELNQLLSDLRTALNVPPPSASRVEVRWISSEWCGLFFLSCTLERLAWIPAWRLLTDFQAGGVACLVAGVALAIAEKFDAAVPALDPGIALFAGYVNDPDLVHMRRVVQEFPRETRLRVLRAAFPHEEVDDAAESWHGAFERLAGTLLRDFGLRIRGFRQAARQGIVRSFIARPGRIRIERERLVVIPAPNPFHVALHVSGLDETVDAANWLGGRRIEFDLGDV
jgi:hypothetical protein